MAREASEQQVSSMLTVSLYNEVTACCLPEMP